MPIFNLEYKQTVQATEITLDKNSIVLITAWDTEQITATLIPAEASNSITWTSSDTTIATVDQTGLVTCVTPGTATITATTDNGLSATCEVSDQALIYDQSWYWTTVHWPLKSAKEYMDTFWNECVDGVYQLKTKDWTSTYFTYCDMTTLWGWRTMIFNSVQNKLNNNVVDLHYNDTYWTNWGEKNATISNLNNGSVNVATLATENVNADTMMVYCGQVHYRYYNGSKWTAFFTPTLNYSYWTNNTTWKTFKETYQSNWWFSNGVWDIPNFTSSSTSLKATSLYTNSYQEKTYSHTYSRMWFDPSFSSYDSKVIFWIWLYSKWYQHSYHINWQWYQCVWLDFSDYYYNTSMSETTQWLNCRVFVREN